MESNAPIVRTAGAEAHGNPGSREGVQRAYRLMRQRPRVADAKAHRLMSKRFVMPSDAAWAILHR